jgi:uncharacterized membrane protein YqjE
LDIYNEETVSENKKFTDIFRVKNIINALIGFIETKVELYKIQFKEEIAKALSSLILVLMMSMAGLLFLLFLSLFLSILLNEILGSHYLGYLLLTLVYLVIGILLFLKRKNISEFMTNMIFSEEEPENEDNHEE